MKDCKRNYKVGDLVTLKNGNGEKFKVSMLSALGIFLEDMEGSSIRSVFNPEQLMPLNQY